jgi:hypothetical protein
MCFLGVVCAKVCARSANGGVRPWEAAWDCARSYRRINQITPLVAQAKLQPITDVPTVVQLDGIWLTIQSQTQKEKPDRRKRRRKARKGQRVVVLVALGFWNDGSGRREILDWEIAKSEEHTEWEKLLNRLGQRGVRPERGLQMVVRDGSGGLGEALAFVYGSTVLEQRCLFHKLRNVADKVRESAQRRGEAGRAQAVAGTSQCDLPSRECSPGSPTARTMG